MLEDFLQFLGFIFLDIIEIMLTLKLFSFVSAIPLRLKNIFYLSLSMVLFQVVFWAFFPDHFILDVVMLAQFLFFALIALYYGKSIKAKFLMFYAFFPLVSISLVKRFIVFFVMPLFGMPYSVVKHNTLLIYSITCFSIFLIYRCIQVFHFDFSTWRQYFQSHRVSKLLVFTNSSMALYYLCVQGIDVMSPSLSGLATTTARSIIVLFYFILFLTLLIHLERYVKQNSIEAIVQQKEYRELINYSQHLGLLYQDIQELRQLLTTVSSRLKIGIEQNDISIVRLTYEGILNAEKNNAKDDRLDLTCLDKLQVEAIRHIVLAKLIEAKNKKLKVEVSIPNCIATFFLEVVDFTKLLSFLLDNAIEMSLETKQPCLSIAFLDQNHKLVIVIQSSTKQGQNDSQSVFATPALKKRDDWQFDLRNVTTILNRYDYLTISSQIHDGILTQLIEIAKPD
ncbi:TPA: transcriptional regulator RocA [Streptococcus pyogenes]|uniref:Sensory transduction protein kinase n=1 Tax=Streptococcus pyogenes serotype M28 TaxID=319700 RepID=A0A386CB53_STRPY|nr:sensory transduction protein kinase [Streptococcus pyogenes serotype M28]HEQ1442110.1 transcriptional regulator RocA [Streptococcus pyogenes]HEQ1472410.1 transcriptional regulator RocA [Streptococcus pyogenes]HEQ1514747.1 transcriptional regulator RocA [Streptococcus pyogenes]HEQ1525436.1 transcriptional regulator RocA [Streptococcus pyogenes]